MSEPLRVVIGEDDVLLREGIARLLTEAGFEVVAQAGDADDLRRKGEYGKPRGTRAASCRTRAVERNSVRLNGLRTER